MPTNKFFKQTHENNPEADLFQSLVTESIQVAGVDAYYIIRDTQNIDEVFQEDPVGSFDESFEIEVYIENYDGFNGADNDLMGKWGLQLQDRLSIDISTERFREECNFNQPREKDLIYLPLSHTLLEIKYVEDEEPFYSLGHVPYFKVSTEIFDYSGEEFDTGIEDVDLLDADLTNNEELHNVKEEDANTVWDEEDDEIIDFDVSNPFGEFGSVEPKK